MDSQRYASHIQRENILLRDGGRCRYCGIVVTMQSANMDHVKPWKRGGRTKGKNLVTCCQACNKVKGNQTWLPGPRARKVNNKAGVGRRS